MKELDAALVRPSANNPSPIRTEDRWIKSSPGPVRSQPDLLIVIDQQWHQNIVEILRARCKHARQGAVLVVLIGNLEPRSQPFTHRRSDFVPDYRTTKLRKFCGKDRVHVERYLDEEFSRSDPLGVRRLLRCISADFLRDHPQGLVPGRLVNIAAYEVLARPWTLLETFGQRLPQH